jgi:amino-acid N-acetyltransferase
MSAETLTIKPAEPCFLEPVRELLADSHLPTAGIEDFFDKFVLLVDGERLAGVAGLETYGNLGLLRSVAVVPELRGSGYGRQLVDAIHTIAQNQGISDIYLLTETAEAFFTHLGFAKVDRKKAPKSIAGSKEFSSVCPVSAVLMKKAVEP